MSFEKLTNAQKEFKFYYETQRWSMAEQRYTILIVGLLHLPMALSLIHIAKTQGRFHIFLLIFYTLSSVSHNIAMVLQNHRLYLHANTWKKLTYIYGISLWNLAIIYIMDLSKYSYLRAGLEYFQYAIILIIQENKPQSYHWNWYPIIIHIILFILVQLYSILMHRKYPKYNTRNLAISMLFFCFAFLIRFMIKPPYTFDPKEGETDDYLRIYHSLSDTFIGIAFHWFWKILPPTDHPQVKEQ